MNLMVLAFFFFGQHQGAPRPMLRASAPLCFRRLFLELPVPQMRARTSVCCDIGFRSNGLKEPGKASFEETTSRVA